MKKAVVFGNGVSGRGAKRLLEKEDYQVILVDDKTGLPSEDAMSCLEEVEIFIKSPGIDPENSLVKKAREKNIEVIDEIELGYRYFKSQDRRAKLIAVTGSNGKTTTTSKITELLKVANYKAEFAGNIGRSFCDLLLEEENLDYIVLELSSFQLEEIKDFRPDIAMIINLSPDHLDRYRDINDYYKAKFNICMNQKDEDIFIYNLNDENTLERLDLCKVKNKLGISVDKRKDECYVTEKDGFITYKNEKLFEIENFSLKGRHNLENILFIVSVAKILNISDEVLKNVLYSTKSLEHRMEVFYKWEKTTFINDSKGTNLDSTSFAIEAYKGGILICGGKEKGLPLNEIVKTIKSNIKEVYLIGQMANRYEEALREIDYPIKNIHNLKTLEEVVKHLRLNLDKNRDEKILFSPSTSSFDQFKSYEERGRIFKDLVVKTFNEGERL